MDDPAWRRAKHGFPRGAQTCDWMVRRGRITQSACHGYQDVNGVPATEACCACAAFATPEPSAAPQAPNQPSPAPTAAEDMCEDDDGWRRAKGGRTRSKMSCAWVERKGYFSARTCSSYADIDGVPMADACCGCQAFTRAPTPAPADGGLCEDSPSFYAGRPARTCAWVGRKPGPRCAKAGGGVLASEACPVACGTCDVEAAGAAPTPAPFQCADAPAWHKAGSPEKTCAWLAGTASKSKCKTLEDDDGNKAKDACACVCSSFF